MHDEHLANPDQPAAKSQPNDAEPLARSASRPERAPQEQRGADNRGHGAVIAASGEVTGSGSSAGGGGNREDFDADPQAGGGAVHLKTDTNSPEKGADAPQHNSA